MPNLVFRQVLSDLSEEAHKFHQGKLTEYLWPRDEEYFRCLADDEALYAAYDLERDNQMVGVAYVDEATELDEKTRRWEFGGVYVEEPYRKLGVGSALGIISISNHLVWNATDDAARLIGHVHEFNPHPRRMLTEQLGFLQDGQEIPPIEPPLSMKRNENGQVVGHLFVFQHFQLVGFAEWIAQWAASGCILGKDGISTATKISVPGFNEPLLPRTIDALRNIAKSRTGKAVTY